MNCRSDRGSLAPLLALFLSLTLLFSSLSLSPALAVLRDLRELDYRLSRSLSLLQAVGRLSTMSYGGLEGKRVVRLPAAAGVRILFSRNRPGLLTASIFVEGEEAPSLSLYLTSPYRRQR